MHTRAAFATKVRGLRAKLFNKTRYAEKATMKKTINMHEERDNKHKNADTVQKGAVPTYLLDRENISRAKVRAHTQPWPGAMSEGVFLFHCCNASLRFFSSPTGILLPLCTPPNFRFLRRQGKPL